MNNDKLRFLQITQLVEKETHHLQQIIQRFFESQDLITLEWLQSKLEHAEGIDQLESFSAKFSRLQLTVRPFCCPLPLIAPPALDKLQ